MDLEIKIVELSPNDWRQLKELRLQALKQEPEAFGMSYEEELETTDDEWREKLLESQNGKRKWYLFAKDGDSLVGMISAYTDRGVKVEHLANIVGVYVIPEARRRGVGKKLMMKMIEKLRQVSHIVKLNLRVNTKQEDAIKLYEGLGFTRVALLEKELNVDGLFQDEYEMCKFIK